MKALAFTNSLHVSTRGSRRHDEFSRLKSIEAPSPSIFSVRPIMVLSDASYPVEILSSEDIIIGSVLALALAFLWSFLQGRLSNSDVILWREDPTEYMDGPFLSLNEEPTTISNSTTKFSGSDWKEMSSEENYVFYNTKVRKQLSGQLKQPRLMKEEKKWVIVALLLLFVPVFSFEFFLALSRGILCGESFSLWSVAQELCAPHG